MANFDMLAPNEEHISYTISPFYSIRVQPSIVSSFYNGSPGSAGNSVGRVLASHAQHPRFHPSALHSTGGAPQTYDPRAGEMEAEKARNVRSYSAAEPVQGQPNKPETLSPCKPTSQPSKQANKTVLQRPCCLPLPPGLGNTRKQQTGP